MTSEPERQEPLSPVKQALLEIRRLRGRLEAAERIASRAHRHRRARLPLSRRRASTPEAFWRLLRDGVDAVTEIPRDRWDVDAYYDADPDAAGRMYARHGAFLDRRRPLRRRRSSASRRARRASMDPQQRLLLEVAWEALEHAGSGPDRLAGSATGVFVGHRHERLRAPAGAGRCARTRSIAYFATGTAHSVAAGRLSYVLGLRGPSAGRSTPRAPRRWSRSTSRARACARASAALALAGGVNLILSPELTDELLPRAHAVAGRPLPDVRRRRRRLRARRGRAAWSCSSACPTRWPTAIASSP